MPYVPSEDKIDEIHLTIRGQVDGQRLDQYLVKRFPDYSRSFLQKLIKKEKILLNGKTAKPSSRLRPGQDVGVLLPRLEPLHLKPEAMALDILYEDEYLAILNKPPGLVMHPARGHLSGTLVNGLLAHFENLSDANDDVYRPGIVHRLDRDTSGVLLVAKSNQAHAGLSKQFEDRLIQKEYLALTEGEMQVKEGTIMLPLGIDPKNHERITVQLGGKEAVTNYKVMVTYPKFTLVHVFPKTGRTHQIRVHLKSQNHPIVGDEVYGGMAYLTREQICGANVTVQPQDAAADGGIPLIERQALHALRITFTHPVFNKTMTFGAPLAQDFSRTLAVFQSLWPSPIVAQLIGESYEKDSDGV